MATMKKMVAKKAQSGLGMKSVKSGYDNNSGVTRADFVAIGKGTAKSGAKMKMGGKMAKQAAVAIAMKKAGKTPKKAQDGYTGEPGLLETAGPMLKTKVKERSDDGNYVKKTVTRTRKGATTKSTKTRRTLQGFLSGAPRVSELKNGGKMKSGGSMKKCKYGCK